jgi:D-3-phosphoglycerate dehydrogenase / 2-oxoglutarate reductase
VVQVRILIADSLPQRAIDELEGRGHECVVDANVSDSELADRIRGFDILVVRSTKVKKGVFAHADRLALVIRAGAGTNTIATSAAAARGVLVANVPGRNSAAVAELTMGLLLSVDRRIPDNVADLRAGRWDKKTYGKSAGLLGKTMGIVGLGSIGLLVAERAAAFGITVQAVQKPRETYVETRAAELGIVMCSSLEELASTSDIISLHVPAASETKHLVDKTFLSQLRPGAILLNTSRGDVVDESALLEALDAGSVRAGLDVYADEPGNGRTDWVSALAQHPHVVGTHHIGASTEQAQLATAEGVVEIVDAFTEGQARNCVNLAPSRLGSVTLTVRHLDRPGVLARVLDLLSLARLNVEHMENRVFRGGEAAMASIDIDGSLPEELLVELGQVPNVLGVSATPFAGAADRSRDLFAPAVRPLDARIVRQSGAVEHVSQMLDALPPSERSSDANAPVGPPRGFDPDAYEAQPPGLYVYRLRRGDQEHVGVVADVSAEAFVDGRVRGHEAVQPNRVHALVVHFTTAAVRSELVALLHRGGPAVATATAEALGTAPLMQFSGPDEWEQTVWRVPDHAAAALSEELSAGVHYIADGHHRVAASLDVWRAAGQPADDGIMCAIYPFDGLRLLAFQRRITGPVRSETLRTLLSADFELSAIEGPDASTGCFAVYVEGQWYDATYTAPRLPGAAGLDLAILNEHVLTPLLGLDELSANRLEIVSALASLADQTAACDADGGTLFVLRPPPMDQLTDVADRGDVMPPKTTYFDPKPYAGIFLR